MQMNRFLPVAAFLVSSTIVPAADVVWSGSNGSWNDGNSWFSGAAPGSSDIAVFPGPDAAEATLSDNASVKGVAVEATAAGGVSVVGAAGSQTPPVLTLGASGLRVENGAGPVAIGSLAAPLKVVINGNQNWTNGSPDAVSVPATLQSASGKKLTLLGGPFEFSGTNTLDGGVTVKAGAKVFPRTDTALGTNTVELANGRIVADGIPRTFLNLFRFGGNSYLDGDAPVTLPFVEGHPAMAINQYDNSQYIVQNTAPLRLLGPFALCSNASYPNNAWLGLRFGSGANVSMEGGIYDRFGGCVESSDNRGFMVSFYGSGASLTILGDQAFGAKPAGGTSTQWGGADADIGYNVIRFGRRSDSDPMQLATFGIGEFFSNCGRGCFIEPLEDGLTLTSGFNYGGSVNNTGAPGLSGTSFGFDGDHDLTVSGRVVYGCGGGANFPTLATRPITFTGPFVFNGKGMLRFAGTGDVVLSGSDITGSGKIGKYGSGKLTLAKTNMLTTEAEYTGGALVVDATGADRLGCATNTTLLKLGGIDVQLANGDVPQTHGTEGSGGTKFMAGASRVRRTGGSSATLALGAVSRDNLGTADFESGAATTASANSKGILGGAGYYTADGTDWACVGDDGVIGAFSAYDSADAPGTDKNILVTGGASLGGATWNTLKIAPESDDDILSLGGTLSLSGSGLLFTGAHDYRIEGSTLQGNTSYLGELIVHQQGSGTFTIDSNIGGYRLVKTGPGTLVLGAATNNFNAGLYLNGGVVEASSAASLGKTSSQDVISFDGGTLRATADMTLTHKIAIGVNGGTMEVPEGVTVASPFAISGNGGILRKTGGGTLSLDGASSFSGPVELLGGTIRLGSDTGLGTSSESKPVLVAPVHVTEGTVLDIAGRRARIGNFTLDGGTIADSAEEPGTLGAYRFRLCAGTVEATLADVVVPATQNPAPHSNLFKEGEGMVTLRGRQEYTGTTYVDAGTLVLDGALAASSVLVRGGRLEGGSELGRSLVAQGGVVALDAGTTLGRHLYLGEGSVFHATLDSASTRTPALVATNGAAHLVLDGAALDFTLADGGAISLYNGVTLIDNRGTLPVEGVFAGFPEDEPVKLSSGRTVYVTYCGGDGNDVVLASCHNETVIILR